MRIRIWEKVYLGIVALILVIELEVQAQFSLDTWISSTVSDTLRNEDCAFTTCEGFPKCPYGREEFYKTREGCPGIKDRKYCCRPGLTPKCYSTGCIQNGGCRSGYREMDRDESSCSGFKSNHFCCKTDYWISCFDTSCPVSSLDSGRKECPAGYKEVRKHHGGCPMGREKASCCLNTRGPETTTTRNVASIFETANMDTETKIISETKTYETEDGGTKTVTHTKTSTKSEGGLLNVDQGSAGNILRIVYFLWGFPFVLLLYNLER